MAQYLIGNIKGPKGEDGISPKATVTQVQGGAIISITDATGTTSAEIKNGIDGSGEPIDLSNYATHDEVEAVEDKIRGYNYTPKSYVDSLVDNIDIGVKTVNGKSGDVLISIPDVSEFATDAELAAVQNSIPNATSQLINDSNFVSTTDLENYATTSALDEGLAAKQDTLTAGANITIENNVISSTASGGTTYTAGAGIDITNDEISVDNTVALKSELFSGDYNDLTNKPTIPDISGLATTEALTAGLATKQDILTAGTGIDITGNVISATGGSGSSYTWTDDVYQYEGTSSTYWTDYIEEANKGHIYKYIKYGWCIYELVSEELKQTGSRNYMQNKYVTLGTQTTSDYIFNFILVEYYKDNNVCEFKSITRPSNYFGSGSIQVFSRQSVTNATTSVGANFEYIKNNYAKTTDLAAKQDALTAGDGITIENNVISVSGGSSSINVDGVSIINDNGTYKTAIGGGTVVTPTVDYLVNGSGTTTNAINPDSYVSPSVNFSTPMPAGTYDVTYTLVNHDDNDASTTITTTFTLDNNSNELIANQQGVGSLGFWIGSMSLTGSIPYEGIFSMYFNGSFTAGINVEITGCTISANGTNYLDNQTITFENGAQPGQQSMVYLVQPITFTETLVGPGYDDDPLTINLSGTVTVKNRNDNDSVVTTYDFTNEPYTINGGGAPVFYYDGNDYSHDYILNMVLCSVSSRDQDTGAFNMTGITGVQLQNGSPGNNYYAELTNLSFSLGGSQTQYINPDFLPLGDNLYVQDGRVHANGAPMYDGHLVIYDTDHNNGWYLTTDGNTITLNPCPWNN